MHIANGIRDDSRYRPTLGMFNTAVLASFPFCTDLYNRPFAVTVSCDTPDTSIGDKKIFFKGVK